MTTALTRILYMLARDQAAQKRLRSEIRAARQTAQAASPAQGPVDGGWQRMSLAYDALMDLPYLDAVVRETFRMYPPTNMLNRTCTRDAVLPLQFPVRSATTGEEVHAVRVPAGTNVILSILGANHEQRVWGADAAEWRPGRWLDKGGERIGRDLAFGQEGVDSGSVRYPGVYGSM